jgi:hypothetical protein
VQESPWCREPGEPGDDKACGEGGENASDHVEEVVGGHIPLTGRHLRSFTALNLRG